MKEFIIATDSTVDLPKAFLEENHVLTISLSSYVMDGVTYKDLDGLSHEEFFEKITNGSLPTTSQY